MQRTCQACGQTFDANPRAKFCSASCRSKAHRGTVVTLRPDAPTTPAPAVGGLLESTRAALTEAGREATPLGMAVLELAATIASRDTPPAAKATLTREFRATLADALKGAAVASSVDELRRRRAALRTG